MLREKGDSLVAGKDAGAGTRCLNRQVGETPRLEGALKGQGKGGLVTRKTSKRGRGREGRQSKFSGKKKGNDPKIREGHVYRGSSHESSIRVTGKRKSEEGKFFRMSREPNKRRGGGARGRKRRVGAINAVGAKSRKTKRGGAGPQPRKKKDRWKIYSPVPGLGAAVW